MESSGNRKRGYSYEHDYDYDHEHVEDPSAPVPESKKPKLPALASVVVEALKLDSLQKLCSSLEPLFRRIVSEEVERALTKFTQAKLSGRSSPPRLQCSEGKNLQLHFRTRMPPHLFTGGKVEGEQCAAIHVILIDTNTGHVVQTGPESTAKLNIVVLEGDFNEEADEDWTQEHFESHEVKEREGKRPILTGDLQVTLKEGVGTLGELTFNDNSSWIRSRKFRLGVKVAPGFCEGTRVREAKTEAFAVKDHRGELYKKHYPPALHDEVWRLDRIAKDGALHKKLVKANIVTVEDFLRLLVRDPQKLRSILGSGMSNKMWENTVEHAKTCVLGGKLYIYYADESHRTGVVFNHIYELRGLLADGQFISLESLNHNQKILVDSLVKRAYENWNQVVEYDGKVLNSLSSVKKGVKPLTLPTQQSNCATDQYNPTEQNRQLYISQEQNLHCQQESNRQSVPSLIEFPLVRSDQSVGQTLNNSQAAFPSSTTDYWSIETPGLAACYTPADWTQMRNREEMEGLFAEEVRMRSTEMLQSEDIQKLLRTLSMGVGVGMGAATQYTDGDCFSYGIPYDTHRAYHVKPQEHSRSSGKAVVGWLKLKAALRWGIFIRKKAAERRAQLVELDDQ